MVTEKSRVRVISESSRAQEKQATANRNLIWDKDHITEIKESGCVFRTKAATDSERSRPNERQLHFRSLVMPHLKFTLLAYCCLIQNDTIKGTVGRGNQHHPVFLFAVWLLPFCASKFATPKNSVFFFADLSGLFGSDNRFTHPSAERVNDIETRRDPVFPVLSFEPFPWRFSPAPDDHLSSGRFPPFWTRRAAAFVSSHMRASGVTFV